MRPLTTKSDPSSVLPGANFTPPMSGPFHTPLYVHLISHFGLYRIIPDLYVPSCFLRHHTTVGFCTPPFPPIWMAPHVTFCVALKFLFTPGSIVTPKKKKLSTCFFSSFLSVFNLFHTFFYCNCTRCLRSEPDTSLYINHFRNSPWSRRTT